MKKKLLWILALTSTCFSLPVLNPTPQQNNTVINELLPILNTSQPSLPEIKTMLYREAPMLQANVIDKVLKTLECSSQYELDHNHILTIIDYSLPSNEKRLWIFDTNQKKLLFYTYVSHGIKSGTLLTQYFSNKYNSKASSIGVYKTEKAYYGREGLSLRLSGLDRGFNDNASNRAIVMHGGWYVEEKFIKKYGRPGRSWGCPALPIALYKPIINTIKDDSLLVAYYPSDNWLSHSKFLNCGLKQSAKPMNTPSQEEETRDDILFADLNNNHRQDEDESVVAITADNYEKIFHNRAPLSRMIRRQIDNTEYIALSSKEFGSVINDMNSASDNFKVLNFIVPVVKMRRGYYATEMHIVDRGKIKNIIHTAETNTNSSFDVNFEAKPSIHLRSSAHFIRWLGL